MPRLRSALQTAAWGVAQHSCPAFRQRRASSLELRSLASRLAVDEAAQQQLVCVARNTHGRGMGHLVRSWRTHSGEFVAMYRGPILASPNVLANGGSCAIMDDGRLLAARPFHLKLCVYLTIDDAIFGLSGFRSRVRVFGMMIRSISSIGIAPSKT